LKLSPNQNTDTSAAKKKKEKAASGEKELEPEVPVSNKQYISLKKPVERSIFYQHSKQGMKYWYEEKKPQSCEFSIALI